PTRPPPCWPRSKDPTPPRARPPPPRWRGFKARTPGRPSGRRWTTILNQRSARSAPCCSLAEASMLPMSPQVFAILSALVAEHAGLHFDEDHASIFADKVASRAAAVGFDSLLDYYYFLRYDA